jgi:hypothetical protein
LATRAAAAAAAPDHVAFEIEEALGFRISGRIDIALGGDGIDPQAFVTGARCLLFLAEPGPATAVLAGSGDAGRWPRLQPNWIFTPGHVQPLEVVVEVVEALLAVDGMDNRESRIKALRQGPFSRTSLGQIASLQYAARLEHWPDRLSGGIDSRMARGIVATGVLLKKNPLDSAARVALVDLTQDLPPSAAIPPLIAGLKDLEVAARDAAFAALETVVGDGVVNGKRYSAVAPEAVRLEIASDWSAWFEKRRPSFLRQDVPGLLNEMRSPIELRKVYAHELLQLISGEATRLVAGDAAAAEHWSQWWKKTEQSFR